MSNQLKPHRDNTSGILISASKTTKQLNKKLRKSFFKSKKRAIRYGLVSVNVGLLLGVIVFVTATRSSGDSIGAPAFSLSAEQELTDPLDTLSGADIAVNVSQLVRMDQATAVRNNADSVNTQLDVVASDSQVVAKPQIVQTNLKSVEDIEEYTVLEGDTIDSIAEKRGISANSIRWSNDLTGSTIDTGKVIIIPPVEGFIYTVEDGDTPKSIADDYSASAAAIIAFNDAEIKGISKDQQIVIPNGEIPAPIVRRPAFASINSGTASGFRFGGSAVYGYNGYDTGYCTWHASNRRAAVGKPIPANLGNASTWKSRAQLAGIGSGSTPQKHAVLWHPPTDYYGHVGFVEDVYADGSILVSDMNYPRWGGVSTRVLSPAQAAAYQYIY